MPFAPCISICFVLVFSCDLFFYFKIIATAVQVQIFCMRFDSFNCVLEKLNILVIQAFRLEETGLGEDSVLISCNMLCMIWYSLKKISS